jgi:hypothetical protein
MQDRLHLSSIHDARPQAVSLPWILEVLGRIAGRAHATMSPVEIKGSSLALQTLHKGPQGGHKGSHAGSWLG